MFCIIVGELIFQEMFCWIVMFNMIQRLVVVKNCIYNIQV